MSSATVTRRLRPALPAGTVAAAVLGLLIGLLTLVAPAPAGATSTYLCSSYTGCARAGYPHAGYGAANGRMYWRMYAGHNCTNYVAYRMIKNGMSAERPWSGSGMAYNWGIANARITDQTPQVGAVAWWNRNTGGVGSSGHVAYVEKVISNREIVISEDSWGGDFDWRRIVKDGSGWPSGFIHFIDKQVINTIAPAITGTPKVGFPLRAAGGRWQGRPTAVRYQWLANGVAVPGAVAATYWPTAAQVGMTIAVRVTATRAGFQSAVTTSTASAPVAKGSFRIDATTAVSGTPVVGSVLTATPATLAPAPERAAIQWRADGVVIPAAAGRRTFTLTPDLVGKRITVLTIARRAGYVKATAHSPAVGPVLAGAIEVTRPYSVAGRPRFGETLTIRPGVVTPPDATASYTWLRDGTPIPGATLDAYRLTAADVGHDLSAQVRLTKPNYLERVETVRVGLVRAPATVRVRAAGRVRAAVVDVRVWAPGGYHPSGEIVVKVGDRKVRAHLKDGRATLEVRNVEPGRRTVLVRFTGSQVVMPGSATDRIQVKR